MKENIIYKGLNNSPVNSVASRVLGGGTNYQFENTEPNREESQNPLPITWGKMPFSKDFINLTGQRAGLLVVLGWNNEKGRWVCRCSCGTYVYRSSRAIKNEKNKADACYQCSKLIQAKRHYHYLKTGRDINSEAYI